MALEGLPRVLKNLNKEIAKIEGVAIAGLLEAGLFIKAQSGKVIPVEYGNLKGSCYVIASDGSKDNSTPEFSGPKAAEIAAEYSIEKSKAHTRMKKETMPTAEIGYTASYAIFVHENLEAEHRIGKQAKFLQNAMENNHNRILSIITKRAKQK